MRLIFNLKQRTIIVHSSDNYCKANHFHQFIVHVGTNLFETPISFNSDDIDNELSKIFFDFDIVITNKESLNIFLDKLICFRYIKSFILNHILSGVYCAVHNYGIE